MKEKHKLQIIGILAAALSIMLFISLVSHNESDESLIYSDEAIYGNPIFMSYANIGGMMGVYFSHVAFYYMGYGAYFGLLFMFVLSLKLAGYDLARRFLKHTGVLWAVASLFLITADIQKVSEGVYETSIPDGIGALGHTLIVLLIHVIGAIGTYILSIAALISILVYYFAISHRFRNTVTWSKTIFMEWFSPKWETAKPTFSEVFSTVFWEERFSRKGNQSKPSQNKRLSLRKMAKTKDGDMIEANDRPDKIVTEQIPKSGKLIRKNKAVKLPGKPESIGENGDLPADGSNEFEMPSIEFLRVNPHKVFEFDKSELEQTAQNLRNTLETFGVRLGGNIEMFPGPIITRFEIKPAAGIKVSQIANLSEDLALNLKAKSIRIVAPIPGKAAIGIEIPNRNPQLVYLRDIIESEAFHNNKYQLPLAMGKDISGKPFVTDLASMPHLLIAGTTGSGKSVCINIMITSLMYSLHPNNLRFIFIDPKMLELTIYKTIPYLDDKVVTNSKQAERVLSDAVMEMEHRYRTLANESVRNIVDYNNKMKTDDKRLPYIVIIIDELADLMMSTQSGRVELLITRLAQMARAVGIHLILATQRPSVDVITGLIKANFPSRIAFQVATRTDSRTILDGNGAERLLGNGDMLYLETGSPEPERLHGPFISSEETEAIIGGMKDQPYSVAKKEITKTTSEEKTQIRQLTDPVMLEAVETVIRQGQASVSLLQRKLGIGYQRAARLVDDLEEMKVIGPYNESKARDVLVDKSFLDDIKKGRLSKT